MCFVNFDQNRNFFENLTKLKFFRNFRKNTHFFGNFDQKFWSCFGPKHDQNRCFSKIAPK